jgi:(2Fe-2S) ferredoxin
MHPYKKHIFVCENIRPENSPKGCCFRKDGPKIRSLLKEKLANKGLHKTYRINSAGCLGVCEHGAALVIYPQSIWYGKVSEKDVDEIIDESILGENQIDRLLIHRENDEKAST